MPLQREAISLNIRKGMVIQMVYYLIICRSLTQAQRTQLALEQAGITAQLLRAPRAILHEGCGYCVKLAERNLADGLKVLSQAGLPPKRVFLKEGDGSYQEVLL